MRLFNTKDPFDDELQYLSEEDQQRIALGNDAQVAVAADFKKRFPRSKLISMSTRSQKKTDIEIAVSPELAIKVEVKHIKAMVTVYDSLLRRGDKNELFDWFAKRLTINPAGLGFTALMDAMRRKDKAVGFVGDPGTAPATGRVPPWWITNAQALGKLRQKLMQRYAEKGDNYLAIVGAEGVRYFHISGPVVPELGNDPFPNVVRAKTDTYGRAPPGQVRAAIKVYLGL